MIKKLQQFCWICGFCSLVQLHRTNESPPSSLNCIFIVPLYKYEPFNGISPTLTEKGVKIEQQQLERRTLYLVCHLVEHDIFKERNGPIVLERALTHTVLGYIFKCTCLFVCLFVCLYVFFNFFVCCWFVRLLDCLIVCCYCSGRCTDPNRPGIKQTKTYQIKWSVSEF